MTESLTKTPRDGARPRPRLRPGWRKLLLAVHIWSALGALVTDGVLLTLAVTGRISGTAELIRAVYLVMELLLSAALLPFALIAVVTGLLLGLGTPWGVVRYYWVIAKLVLTLTTLAAGAFLLRPSIGAAAANAVAVPVTGLPSTGVGPIATTVTTASALAVVLLAAAHALAIWKPWGQVRRRR